MLLPRLLPWPGTPRLKEPMSRRKRFRYCAPTGLPKKLVGLRSVTNSVVGEVKSFRLRVQFSPPWHREQLCAKSVRPVAMSAGAGAFGKSGNGPLGVRTALRTHSRSAVNAGTLLALPGKVTVSCGRLALGVVNALTTPGATLRSLAS